MLYFLEQLVCQIKSQTIFLYGDHYAHRSSASHLTPPSVEFIAEYLETLRPGKRFKLAVEIGCNEMVLLDRVLERSERAIGIDPLWP